MPPGKIVTLVTSRDRLIADKPSDIGQRAQHWLEKRGGAGEHDCLVPQEACIYYDTADLQDSSRICAKRAAVCCQAELGTYHVFHR